MPNQRQYTEPNGKQIATIQMPKRCQTLPKQMSNLFPVTAIDYVRDVRVPLFFFGIPQVGVLSFFVANFALNKFWIAAQFFRWDENTSIFFFCPATSIQTSTHDICSHAFPRMHAYCNRHHTGNSKKFCRTWRVVDEAWLLSSRLRPPCIVPRGVFVVFYLKKNPGVFKKKEIPKKRNSSKCQISVLIASWQANVVAVPGLRCARARCIQHHTTWATLSAGWVPSQKSCDHKQCDTHGNGCIDVSANSMSAANC